MVVDIGGGTTEIAVMSLGGVVVKIIKSSWNALDQSIIAYMKENNLMIETQLLKN